MKKISLTIFIFSILLIPSLALAQTNSEILQKIEETKKEREKLLEQEEKLQTALNELSKEGQTLQTNVKTLDATRSKLANDLKITQSNINTSNLTIQKLENDIDNNESEIDIHKQAIKKSIQKIATYDNNNLVLDILSYKNLDEVWSDTVNIWDLQDKLRERISVLEQTQVKLIENKVAKESQKKQLVSLSTQLDGQKRVADETRASQALLLAATKNKEAEYQKMLADNKERQEEFERLLFQFESSLTASDVSLRPPAGRGALGWPLDNIFITQMFGRNSFAKRVYASGTHSGTDFRATVGTKVKSARGGVVSGIGNTDEQKGCYSYGRWILIKHDNGLSTLYTHLSGSIVSLGESVVEGQTIGYSGGQPGQYGSGFSTGPHLHFGVFVTAGVNVLPYTSSKNCQKVSIPVANPQDYLDPMAYLPNL